MTDSSGNRRDFLRGIFGRAAREAASNVPDVLVEAARLVNREAGSALTPGADGLPEAFDVPADQQDIAHQLVADGALTATADGRFALRGGEHGNLLSLGSATREWVERTRGGQALTAARPRDAITLETVRAELDAPG
jgi:hypothetical protein